MYFELLFVRKAQYFKSRFSQHIGVITLVYYAYSAL